MKPQNKDEEEIIIDIDPALDYESEVEVEQ